MSRNLSALAGKLIKKEKASRLTKRKPAPTLIEQAAEEWMRTEEQKKRKTLEEDRQKREAETVPRSVSLEEYTQDSIKAGFEGLDWAPFQPQEDESSADKREISINSATVRALAKKLIAREWRRALGKPPSKPWEDKLEKKAAAWREARELEKLIQEEKRHKLMTCALNLNTVLSEFAAKLIKVSDSANLAELFEECLEDLGKICPVEWSPEDCRIWFEPWPEIRNRRITGTVDPFLYTAKVDSNFDIASIEEVDDEDFLSRIQEGSLIEIYTRLAGENNGGESGIEDLLEDTLSEQGRLLALIKTDTGWSATLELWEAMRLRRDKKLGEEFSQLTYITIDYQQGGVSFRVQLPDSKG